MVLFARIVRHGKTENPKENMYKGNITIQHGPKVLKDNAKTEKHKTFNIKTKQHSPEIKNTLT